jgi:D-serine deaminase-like pyridoxal phosphate-dependent protein
MKFSRTALAASFALLAFAQARAEEYQGVLQFDSTSSRSEVRAQAIEAARSPNQHPDAASSAVAAAPASSRDRREVQAEARAHAHRPNQNLRVEAFANSRIPSYYSNAKQPSTAQAAHFDSDSLR